MTEHPEITAVGPLVLARLLPDGDKGNTVAKVKADLEPLLQHRWSGPALTDLIERTMGHLESSGLVARVRKGKSKVTRPTITSEGRRQALEFLGLAELPPKTTWGGIKKTYLLSRSLGLRAPTGGVVKKFSNKNAFKPSMLKAGFGLPIGDYPTMKQATDALTWKLMGLESCCDRPLNLKAILTALVERELGDGRPVDPKKAVDRLLSRVVKARRDEDTEFREAAIRAWVDRASAGSRADSPPTQPSPTRGEGLNMAPPSVVEEVPSPSPSPLVGEGRGGGAGPSSAEPSRGPQDVLSLETFADRVLAAGRASATGRFGADKVFIAHLWRAAQDDPALRGMGLDAFKRRLAEANNARLLDLSRADLVEAMDPAVVSESETHYHHATFHFVRIPEGAR
jgi:hypothetical protein